MDNRERARARDKNKGDQFRWKKNLKIYSGCEKMRNASSHQGKMPQRKKSEQEHIQ